MTTDPAPATGTLTWRTLWDETSLVTGRPQARWLCEEASGAFGPEFLEVVAQPATERCVAHLDSMLARVRQGEPLQYVLGHWSFRRLDLLVDQRVLIPRPETELVVEVALGCARQAALEHADRPLQLADLGTGSGAIGLSLATELPRGLAEVWLTDVSADALDVARANTAGLGMAGTAVRFGHGSWFVALPPTLRGQLAVVVSNPPYIAHDDERVQEAVRAWEPAIALFATEWVVGRGDRQRPGRCGRRRAAGRRPRRRRSEARSRRARQNRDCSQKVTDAGLSLLFRGKYGPTTRSTSCRIAPAPSAHRPAAPLSQSHRSQPSACSPQRAATRSRSPAPT